MHTSVWRHPSLASRMVEENTGNENTQNEDRHIDDLTCIHWGYLNVLQLHDVNGKKIKHPRWHTFWTDLCGSTLRLYKDTSLPQNSCAIPPGTMIGPRPESQIKHAFFSLLNGSLKDYDATESSPRLSRKNKMGRKHVLQVVLANFSVYFLQAPTMSAFYRWRAKLQSSIENANAPENVYDEQLRQAKMALYEQQRCYVKPEPTYPDATNQDAEEEDNISAVRPLLDPRLIALKEKLYERRRLLYQLEKQERDFIGSASEEQCSFTRIEFSATAKKDYFLVVGRRDTLIKEGQTFTVFGRLPNGRWRCFVDRKGQPGSSEDISGHDNHTYPLIGSVPTSVIVELNQPSRIKELVDSLSVSSDEVSPPGTPPDYLSTTSSNSFTYEDLSSSQSPRRSSDAATPSSQASRSEPYSNHKYGNTLAPPNGEVPATENGPMSEHTPRLTRPTQISPSGNQTFTHRVTRPSTSSISPTSPRPESISNAISDLNRALESLNSLKARSRVSSNLSTCSRTSNSSQEDESSDMSRGSRIEINSDDESVNKLGAVVRRRKRRDIHIFRKLHAKGISIIVGSSSSSEDESDIEEEKKESGPTTKSEVKKKETQTRKIEGLQTSKEKLTEKITKGAKSSPENPTKLQNGDRSNVDKPTGTTDLLREFSENGCYGEPIRNSVTQTQFKPLASHEIPPPLHQRRTLQMTRKENEGFGFVLQTNTIIQTGAFSDSMTFVSNVSEDGPAYLAGMRPGDVIIEVEKVTVEDEHHQMIVERLKDVGLTVRLVVVYKDAIQRMRLSTRMLALKARLSEAEKAYDEVSRREKLILNRVDDPTARDVKVRMAVIYIHIQIASTTFARNTPETKDSVDQIKRTPTELLQLKQTSEMAKTCGEPTTGYGLAREFAASYEPGDRLEPERNATSLKYGSDNSLNLGKKRSENNSKQKTLKKTQRESFVSYVEFDRDELGITNMPEPCGVTSRRRVKSDGCDPELLDELQDELPPLAKTLPAKARAIRPDSYMFAVGSQNAINTTHFKTSSKPRVNESNTEDGGV